TNQERCDMRNNIVYVTAPGNTLALIDDTGALTLTHNWFKTGWVYAFFGFTGSVADDGTSVVGSVPGFVDEAAQDFHLVPSSACINTGTVLNPAVLPTHS